MLEAGSITDPIVPQ